MSDIVLTAEYKTERERFIRASCMQNHTGTRGICGMCWADIKELRKGIDV